MTKLTPQSIAFTLAAGAAFGAVVGIGHLMSGNSTNDRADVTVKRGKQQKPAKPAADAAPLSKDINAQSYMAVVTKVPTDNVIHVRAHTWVAEFAMASVCIRGRVAEPKPCAFEADVQDEAGQALSSFKKGDSVRLSNLQSSIGNVAPHVVTTDIPDIRPRQDLLAGPVPAQVVKLIDGDTVQIVAQPWKDHYVLTDIRIGEIDTPEKKGRAKCAAEADLAEDASAATRQLIEGKTVMLYNVKFEKYGGRVLGDIRTPEGISAAQNLIDRQLARPYDGGTKQSWCGIR